jgi:hypothetical protein
VRDIDADQVIEQHAAEMGRRAGAGGAVLHLALVGFGVRDELLEIVDRQVLARDEHNRNLGDERDRGEIGGRVVERLLVDGLALRVGADGAEHGAVAVGSGVSDAL